MPDPLPPDPSPPPRTLSMFREWFTLELCSMAIDLCEEPIETEEE